MFLGTNSDLWVAQNIQHRSTLEKTRKKVVDFLMCSNKWYDGKNITLSVVDTGREPNVQQRIHGGMYNIVRKNANVERNLL